MCLPSTSADWVGKVRVRKSVRRLRKLRTRGWERSVGLMRHESLQSEAAISRNTLTYAIFTLARRAPLHGAPSHAGSFVESSLSACRASSAKA